MNGAPSKAALAERLAFDALLVEKARLLALPGSRGIAWRATGPPALLRWGVGPYSVFSASPCRMA